MSDKSINRIQDEIIEEFSILGNDMESIVFYIMELGDKLELLEDKFKVDSNLIKGCQSKVWLNAEVEDHKLILNADSNTDITRGLISLLVRTLSGQSLDDIIHADLYFIEKIGMNKVIGSQRSNGLTAMIKQIKLYALAYKTKLQQQT
ncbi:MAG: SufE family protein [Cyclobacteriaceae bacterium]|nr:SufE family protein [Cyclobacteriaceae bacterium]